MANFYSCKIFDDFFQKKYNFVKSSPMKRIASILLIVLTIYPLWAIGQSGIVFPSLEWNFGTLSEEAGLQSHRFVFRNEGDHPEVILQVTATCGCMKPRFERRPVLAGAESAVEVQFQPAGQRGKIDRTLTVYGDRQQVIARLRVLGEVVPRPLTLEERFPVDVGSGIRLSNNHLWFGSVEQGSYAPVELRVVNTAARTRRLSFEPELQSGWLVLDYPEHLQAGEEGVLRLGYRIPKGSSCYGTQKDTYYIEVDGVRQYARLMTECVAVDAKGVGADSPCASLEPPVIRLGEVASDAEGRALFTLNNSGRSALVVRAVECPKGVSTNLRAGESIPAGDTRHFELRLDTRGLDYGVWVKRLRIVVNDSLQPLLQPRISATIVER